MSLSCDPCVICLETIADGEILFSCCYGHRLHDICLEKFLMANIFENIYKLREDNCCIKCVVPRCESRLDPIVFFQHISVHGKLRFLSLIRDLANDMKIAQAISKRFHDILTLKCPNCKLTVDPFPDACSVILCLGCGHQYCNYCFRTFPGGELNNGEDAHTHVTQHHPADDPIARSAFLPYDLILQGHLLYRQNELMKHCCLLLHGGSFNARAEESAYSKDDEDCFIYDENIRNNVALALLMCYQELVDLGLDINRLWLKASAESDTEAHLCVQLRVPQLKRNPETLLCTVPMNSFGATAVNTVKRQNNGDYVGNQLEFQLTNAIKAHNSTAVQQLLHSFGDCIGTAHVDQESGLPLVSLALLTSQPEIAVAILRRGADPLLYSRDSGTADIDRGISGPSDMAPPNHQRSCEVRGISGRSVLFVVMEFGSCEVLDVLLECNPGLNLNQPVTKEKHRYFPIHVAAKYNHTALVRRLVSLGADLEVREGEFGYTPLSVALVMRSEWTALELLTAGANHTTASLSGRTPLCIIAEKGLSTCLSYLLSTAAAQVLEVEVVLSTELRPLHVAATHCQCEIVSLLLQASADVNCSEKSGGYTPLMLAILSNNMSCALALIREGCPDSISADRIGLDLNRASRVGRSAMYMACERGMSDVVVALHAAGVDLNQPATTERSLLPPTLVAVMYKQTHLIYTMKALGANLNLIESATGYSFLMIAVIAGNEPAVNALLQCRVDPAVYCRKGKSALCLAAERGHAGIVRLLVTVGGVMPDSACSRSNDYHGGRALYIAALHLLPETIFALLLAGADLNARDDHGATAAEMVFLIQDPTLDAKKAETLRALEWKSTL